VEELPFLLYKKEGRFFVLYLLCVAVVCTIVFISFPIDNPGVLIMQDGERGAMPVGEGSVPSYVGERNTWMFFTHPKNVRIMLSLFVLVFNVCVRLFFFTIRRDESIKELEREKLRSELEYLKYQINPHFFMNSLNNIHALIDIDKDKAQTAVQELSGMMRYVLYEKSSIFVPLEKEISFIKDFIELMRLRYTDKLEVTTNFTSDTKGVNVPSLLFMQFVENAFKHGVTYAKKSFINISLFVDEAGGCVAFSCRISLPDTAKVAVSTVSGGIGIENAKKRLGLLFGNKARLLISVSDGWYNVEMKIPIQYDKMYNS
jgi:hypothetical protein